ncbi:HTH domain-containing protein [Natronoarchaeum mannanilyticum]|uniref:HTH domain-containing protein n=1 Tax=Natronoarchaeum mannanilyticum TaxID=926360 RepID=UPI003613CDED
MENIDRPLELDVYMRAFAPDAARRRQEAMLERMRELRDRGTAEAVSVTRWSNQVSVSPARDRDPPVGVETYRELDAATDGTELSIEPFFRERSGAGGDRTVLSLPVLCVAIRRDGEITGVYPSSAPDGSYSVTDCLDALAAGDDLTNLAEGVVLDPEPV